MKLFGNIVLLLLGAIILFMLESCSSSSQTSRYNKPKEESSEGKNRIRFTSENDERPDESEADNFTTSNVADDVLLKKEFAEKYSKLKDSNIPLTDREKILFEIASYLNTPYHYGGNDRNGIDCSAFTRNVLKKSIGLYLPRTAREQYLAGEFVKNMSDLKFGDLIFFDTSKNSYPGHVGIYLGDDRFAHSSSSSGVIISSLKNPYYSSRFIGGRRINISTKK